MNIVYITCCANGFFGLKLLRKNGIQVQRVITISEKISVAWNVSGYFNVRPYCENEDISLVELDDYNVTPEHLGDDPDLLIVNGWNRLINKDVMAVCSIGALGVHAGHPPIGHGRAPIPWNIIKGYRDIEVYVFWLTERADDGDIVGLQTVEISPYDTASTVYEKVMFAAGLLFMRAIISLQNGALTSEKQNIDDAVFFPKRTPQDGLIDFCQPAETLFNFVRALQDPYPPAFTYLDGVRWLIDYAIPFDAYLERSRLRIPGRIIGALPSGILVQTETEPLWILKARTDEKSIIPTSLEEMEGLIGKRFSRKAIAN